MKVAWMSHPTELEHDIRRSARDHPDIEVRFGAMGSLTDWPVDAVYDWHMESFTKPELLRVLSLAKSWADLIILRYPYYILHLECLDDCMTLLRDATVLVWHSEQGPTREWALKCSSGWHHIALNTPEEMDAFRSELPTHPLHLYYLPFGCAAWRDDELIPDVSRGSRLIADGNAHYGCGHYGGWKETSVSTMIVPFLGTGLLGLWGHPLQCGWNVLSRNGEYRGAYPSRDYIHVYPACDIYLGITWNWNHGGYGTKLARALSTGIPVIWHGDGHGPIHGEHVLRVHTEDEAKKAVHHLLTDPSDRKALGQRGRMWAAAQWEWGSNLKRVASELGRNC